MSENLIYFILGLISSWGVSHIYYRKSDKEKPSWFPDSKESFNAIKEIITKNPNDIDWTADQIVKLYKNKLIEKTTSDPLPYNFCPECGSKIKKSSYFDESRDENYFIAECENCDWSDWTQ